MKLRDANFRGILWIHYIQRWARQFSERVRSKNKTSSFHYEKKKRNPQKIQSINIQSVFVETFDKAEGCRRLQAGIWIHCLPLNSLLHLLFPGISANFIYWGCNSLIFIATLGTFLLFSFLLSGTTFFPRHHHRLPSVHRGCLQQCEPPQASSKVY